MIKELLKSRLINLGYNQDKFERKIEEIDFSIFNKIINADEKKLSSIIKIISFEKPNAEIMRTFLNIDRKNIQQVVIDGEMQVKNLDTATNGKILIADYMLDKSLCFITVTTDMLIEIILYNPEDIIVKSYTNKWYNEVYGEERNITASEYIEALQDSGRLAEYKIREIMDMLLNDLVIDELTLSNGNPRFKLYDNPDLFASGITAYSIKYINKRINKIELAEKLTYIKRLGKGIEAGDISNDPYLKLNEVNRYADFLLKKVGYYWLYGNEKGQEEIAIYTANTSIEKENTYAEYASSNTKKLERKAKEIAMDFTRQLAFEVDEQYILSILKKLNMELIIPSTDIIQKYIESDTDLIETLRYRFKATSDPKEFEKELYNSIEDNLRTRYRYSIVENVEDDLTTTGNKLNYTGENGRLIQKQSIADFNTNAVTAIIRRETFIDNTQIPQLLGYIYEDMENIGTDDLPVPIIEVLFYIPNPNEIGKGINMYNGTDFEATPEIIINANKFYSINGTDGNVGNTAVIVRYINSEKEILKENKITNVYTGDTFVPEIIPIISDREGKEWKYEVNQMPNIVLTDNVEKNIIEVKYKPSMTSVTINFINIAGKEIKAEEKENIQVGKAVDMSKRLTIVDSEKNEWSYKYSRPEKLIAKENSGMNRITLVYDVVKENVIITYKNKIGKILRENLIVQAIVDRNYTPNIEQIIVDAEGLSWTYISDTDAKILVKEKEENVINLIYDELKAKVITKHIDVDGKLVKDDIINFIQVGKEFTAEYEKEQITDIYGKRWQFKECNKDTIVVQQDNNVITIMYEKVVAEAIINIRTAEGKAIKDAIKEKIQIGREYYPEEIKEIRDKHNKLWKCISGYENIIISENPKENHINLIYEPAMTKIIIRYYDEERNELMPAKQLMLQIGEKYKVEAINKLEDKEGKRWIIKPEKLETIEVKKQEEENIISLYYDKELTEVKLQFRNIYGKQLMPNQKVEAQIGSEYDPRLFDRITDELGERWGLEESDPKRMIVKPTGNSFILIYDEVKVTVVVRHINSHDNNKIIENFITKIRVGSRYTPNIVEKILDKNKKQWKFIGEKDISIVPKENEQENVLDLQYEPDLAKVTSKYINQQQDLVREDIIKEVQIGSELQLKDLEKIIDKNGMGWKLKNVSNRNLIVSENEEKNIIYNYYEPLYCDVSIRFTNGEEKDIIKNKIEKIQLGTKHKINIDNEIIDKEGKIWVYDNISVKEIVVKETGNDINIVYKPLMSETNIIYLEDELNESIVKNVIEERQVGSIYKLEIKNRVIDEEGKYWKYKISDKQEFIVNREDSKNVITCIYEKECTDIVLFHKAKKGDLLKEEKVNKVQIGSIYKPKTDNVLIDSSDLDWKVPDNSDIKFKIFEEKEKNRFDIPYERLIVNIYKRYQNETGEEIKEAVIIKRQSGSDYVPDIEDVVTDAVGREWLYNKRGDIKKISESKNPAIKVLRDENKNFVILTYKPSLINLYIKYEDPFGKALQKEQKVIVQIGSEYKADIIEKIVDKNGNKWTFNPNSKISMKVTGDETKNIIILAYEEQKALITYKYLDESENVLIPSTKALAQIGSNYTPEYTTIVEDKEGKVWEYKNKDIEKLLVSENDDENIITLIYIPFKLNVVIRYVDLKGDIIYADKIVKVQLGSEYKPEIEETLITEESMLFKYKNSEPEIITVKEEPDNSKTPVNMFRLIYEPVYSNVCIKYQNIDGEELREDYIEQLQVGTRYSVKIPQYIKDKKDNQWGLINSSAESLVIKENPKENIVKLVYEIAKVEIIVRYKDIEGNLLKEDEKFEQQIGTEFIPKTPKIILDSENKKWSFFNVNPVKLKVGSINNIVTLSYQEEKVTVLIKYQDYIGKKLKNDERILAQVGSKFVPKVSSKIIYDANTIWEFDYFKPQEIIVSENSSENVIIQIYKQTVDNTFTENEINTKDRADVTNEVKHETEKVIVKNEDADIDKEISNKDENIQNKSKMFTDPYLKELEMTINLSDSEKEAIEKLNEYNNKIISIMHENIEKCKNREKVDIGQISEIVSKEKEIIEKNLQNILKNDKTGNKILKIFEQITKSDQNDKVLFKLQQRKSILVADYYLNKPVSDIEQATYICNRGKNNNMLELIDKSLESPQANLQFLSELKIITLYEKVLLDNYYNTRSVVKDNYFKDPENSKINLSNEIIVLVTNMLTKQAYNLIIKGYNLNEIQKLELKAILKLLTPAQKSTLEEMIQNTSDAKQKRLALKLLKELA